MATKVPAWAKGYVTLKSGVIAFIGICVLILILTGVGISEWKKKNKEFNRMETDLKKVQEEKKELEVRYNLKIDSIESVIASKSEKNKETIIKIVHEKETRIKEINSPAFSNNDIRGAFAN